MGAPPRRRIDGRALPPSRAARGGERLTRYAVAPLARASLTSARWPLAVRRMTGSRRSPGRDGARHDLDAGHARHHPVEDHDVGALALRQGERARAVGAFEDAIPGRSSVVRTSVRRFSSSSASRMVHDRMRERSTSVPDNVATRMGTEGRFCGARLSPARLASRIQRFSGAHDDEVTRGLRESSCDVPCALASLVRRNFA
jgi:hypothetical protein